MTPSKLKVTEEVSMVKIAGINSWLNSQIESNIKSNA